jgi:Zn-dependent protease
MLLNLLLQGEVALFLLIAIGLVTSLTFHEFGHALVAKWCGDNTAERAGRLTLNPAAHIDPVGLLMVVLIGFGYARPVPTNPANYTFRWADLLVSAAGPAMNLILACIAWNFFLLGFILHWDIMNMFGAQVFFKNLVQINLVLMAFNLIPLGSLDGHYILPYFLSKRMATRYRAFNAQYGNLALLGLVALSFVGIPVFSFVLSVGNSLLPFITFIR